MKKKAIVKYRHLLVLILLNCIIGSSSSQSKPSADVLASRAIAECKKLGFAAVSKIRSIAKDTKPKPSVEGKWNLIGHTDRRSKYINDWYEGGYCGSWVSNLKGYEFFEGGDASVFTVGSGTLAAGYKWVAPRKMKIVLTVGPGCICEYYRLGSYLFEIGEDWIFLFKHTQ